MRLKYRKLSYREMLYTTMEVKVLNNYDELSKKSAVFVAKRLLQKDNLVLGLATGDTPKGLYRELVKIYQTGLLDFSEVTTFNLDEYYPISPENAASFATFMKERFFDHVNIPEDQSHLPDGSAQEVEKECKEYEDLIHSAGGIDLQILGIGTNGHIGYNEPGSKWGSETRLVTLKEENVLEDVPGEPARKLNKALTMGIKSIMQAQEVLLLASGRKKAEIIARTIDGEISREVPASILHLHPSVTIYLDRDAASEL